MTLTLIYEFLAPFTYARGERGLWKLWGAATDVSLIIDCEFWHRLSEFHHIETLLSHSSKAEFNVQKHGGSLSLSFQSQRGRGRKDS